MQQLECGSLWLGLHKHAWYHHGQHQPYSQDTSAAHGALQIAQSVSQARQLKYEAAVGNGFTFWPLCKVAMATRAAPGTPSYAIDKSCLVLHHLRTGLIHTYSSAQRPQGMQARVHKVNGGPDYWCTWNLSLGLRLTCCFHVG
jgi:hypothetical protein